MSFFQGLDHIFVNAKFFNEATFNNMDSQKKTLNFTTGQIISEIWEYRIFLPHVFY